MHNYTTNRHTDIHTDTDIDTHTHIHTHSSSHTHAHNTHIQIHTDAGGNAMVAVEAVDGFDMCRDTVFEVKKIVGQHTH